MPVPSYQDIINLSQSLTGLPQETLEERLLSVMAMIASGKAPDGTAVTIGGGGGGGPFTTKQASATAVALINGTQTLASWTTPNDGALHRGVILSRLVVTSLETGGTIQGVGLQTANVLMFGQGLGIGTYQPLTNASIAYNFLVGPNVTVSVQQTSALTGGASACDVEIWGS